MCTSRSTPAGFPAGTVWLEIAFALFSICLLSPGNATPAKKAALPQDDSGPLQSLLDAGRRVRIPAGQYLVSAPWLVDSETLLEGDGNATVIHGRFESAVIAFHGYGKATVETGAVIYGGFRTKLRGVHLKNFGSHGLAMLSTHEPVFISKLFLDSDTNDDGAICLLSGETCAMP